jgi:hypothetical protein
MGLNNHSSSGRPPVSIETEGQDLQVSLETNYDCFAIDYMLETVVLVYCLQLINTFYLYKLGVSKNNILFNRENNNMQLGETPIYTQSAEN